MPANLVDRQRRLEPMSRSAMQTWWRNSTTSKRAGITGDSFLPEDVNR